MVSKSLAILQKGGTFTYLYGIQTPTFMAYAREAPPDITGLLSPWNWENVRSEEARSEKYQLQLELQEDIWGGGRSFEIAAITATIENGPLVLVMQMYCIVSTSVGMVLFQY